MRLLAALCLLAGCSKAAPPAPPAPAKTALPVVANDKPLVYTYVGEDGQFHDASKIDDIPARARKVVRVIDPAQKPGGDASYVAVVDLTLPNHPVRQLDRRAFETLALAQLGPGQHSPFPLPSSTDKKPLEDNGVVIYGTSWCGACKAARAWLKEHGVAFVDKDVEKDAAAAQELAHKCAAAGIAPTGVPVIDAHGTLLEGFDPQRLSALVGARGVQL